MLWFVSNCSNIIFSVHVQILRPLIFMCSLLFLRFTVLVFCHFFFFNQRLQEFKTFKSPEPFAFAILNYFLSPGSRSGDPGLLVLCFSFFALTNHTDEEKGPRFSKFLMLWILHSSSSWNLKIARKTTTENRKMKRLKIRSPDLNHYSKNESESGKNGGKKTNSI